MLFGRLLSWLSTPRWRSLIWVHFHLGGKPLFVSAFGLWDLCFLYPLCNFLSLLKEQTLNAWVRFLLHLTTAAFKWKSAMWIMWWWKGIDFIWPFTNGGYQYLHSGCCYNKLVIGMKTSVKWSSQHTKCTFMHTFFCELKAAFLTFCMVMLKKKIMWNYATTKGQSSPTSKLLFLGSCFQEDLCQYVSITCDYNNFFFLNFS